MASPLSNDAGNASFPDPLAPQPALQRRDALRLDEAAKRVNQGVVVDLPSVHGCCLYLRRECLDRIGPLSLVYGRGYFEDVDLCLRAREAGFRLVAACDVYVSHQSGRSFGLDRYPLIVRNLGVLDLRFPDHAAEDAAHDRADPLKSARAALEEAEPLLDGPTVVLVGRTATRGALLRERLQQAEREGSNAVTLDWWAEQDGTICKLRGEGGLAPRSLVFPLDAEGLERLGAYLGRLSVVRVEFCEAAAMPARLAGWFSAVSPAPLVVVVDGQPAAEAVRRAADRPSSVVTDAMARACLDAGGRPGLRAVTPDASRSHPRVPLAEQDRNSGAVAQSETVLGVLLPQICRAADRLLLSLALRLRSGPRLHLKVFGGAASSARLSALGTCWQSRPMSLEEIAAALDHHAVGRLLLPYRDSSYWVLDAVGRGGRPAAFFAWAPWHSTEGESDLHLDPSETDEISCTRILAWASGGMEAVRR